MYVYTVYIYTYTVHVYCAYIIHMYTYIFGTPQGLPFKQIQQYLLYLQCFPLYARKHVRNDSKSNLQQSLQINLTESQNICQIECQTECQNICQLEWQHSCHAECQQIFLICARIYVKSKVNAMSKCVSDNLSECMLDKVATWMSQYHSDSVSEKKCQTEGR